MKVEKQLKLAALKIETMSSKEIADLTGKQHKHVIRDIRVMLTELYPPDGPNMDHVDVKGVLIAYDDRRYVTEIKLDKSHTLTLITGYSFTLRKLIIDRWQFLEQQLEILKHRQADKKHQLDAMEALHDMLPEDLQEEAISYIKANTVVNKAVSNMFGFPKMLKKADMNQTMLEVREQILDDYIKLFEVIEDNHKIAELLYSKYQPKRLSP